jgi:hypothetical protein
MAKGDVISADDIMPRHIRLSGETPAMTVPAGASLADTRKQLVLRTFASTSGDAVRTAKIVGISPDEVRDEIAALLQTNGNSHDGEMPAAEEKTRAGRAPSSPKSKVRKR